AVNESRRRLGVDSVDLMQYYWQDYGVNRYVDGALYLADAASAGLIRHVGTTNFDVPRMEAMTQAGVRIVSNQ
ncbi:2,5-diketo-D-gluconic acid reductase B, partial [Tetrabaena socialis]